MKYTDKSVAETALFTLLKGGLAILTDAFVQQTDDFAKCTDKFATETALFTQLTDGVAVMTDEFVQQTDGFAKCTISLQLVRMYLHNKQMVL